MLRSRSRGTTPHLGISTNGQVDLTVIELPPEGQPLESTAGGILPKTTRQNRETVHASTTSWFCASSFWARYTMRRRNLMARRALALILVLAVVIVIRLLLDRPPKNSPVDGGNSTSLFDKNTSSWLLVAENQTDVNQGFHGAYTSNLPAASPIPVPKDIDLADSPKTGIYSSLSLKLSSLPKDVSGSRRYPTVSRSMLEKLDLAKPPYPDMVWQSVNYKANSLPFTDYAVISKPKKLPPRVYGIPEPKSRSGAIGTHTRSRSSPKPSGIIHTNILKSPAVLDNLTAVCPTAASDRFLLPLRIAEQESKSRLHFVQLLLLAKTLNRTLVLPNVGKSRMGACGRWNWGVYYDEEGLSDGWITMEGFQEWTSRKAESSESHKGVTSQLVSVGTSIPAAAQRAYTPVDHLSEVAHVSVFANNSSSSVLGTTGRLEDPALHLPGCFTTKYPHMALDVKPIFITIPHNARINTVSEDIITAFRQFVSTPSVLSAAENFNEKERPLIFSSPDFRSEPQVLVVNWDLRYPIFPPSSLRSLNFNSEINYSPQLLKLAKKLAPSEPYLAVHWRMETVQVWDKMRDVALDISRGVNLDFEDDRSILNDCAYGLVDVIARTMEQYDREAHDQFNNKQIRTVWFASDYPYPIARTTKSMQRPPAVKAKSSTFRSFSIEHERAVDIVRRAFEGGGDLEGRSIEDVASQLENATLGMVEEQRVQLTEEEKELLDDPGVLGIMDKLISMNATIFVSGSPRCSKKSSFTKQVLDTRMNKWRKRERRIWNVVDTFG
ncbi:hypothetical protein CPB83DRAFT_805086 [Crepidotus variabilis]|uniref:Uncharacterized protein n=1 Tax=Crepidotus variabilis TaxID=179855 RepID=A0A9P6EQ78_9AGAR|nr:hypothetical protein CPB83DRAFT_805086 [Crepidotus variabilis]